MSSRIGGGIPGWGYSESVLIDGDKLVCTPGGLERMIEIGAASDKFSLGADVWDVAIPTFWLVVINALMAVIITPPMPENEPTAATGGSQGNTPQDTGEPTAATGTTRGAHRPAAA